MFDKKKVLLVLLLFIVSICAISSASATDDATDTIATDNVESDGTVADIDEDAYEATADDNAEIEENDNVLSGVKDESILSKDESEDVLSGLPVYSNQYSIQIWDDNQISSTGGGKFYYYLSPYNAYYTDAYNFKFIFYDVHHTKVYETGFYQGEQGSIAAGNKYITLGKNIFKPGIYIVGAYNKADGNLMSANSIKVSGNAVITANDFNGVYNTGTMTARVTDTKGNPLTSMGLDVVFTKGSSKVTKSYITDSNGYVSFTPPVGAGTWSVTFTSQLSYVTANPVTKTAVITKAPVNIKGYKVTEYKGFKTTIKAKVTSNGKNVNEGTVTFKINGKTYKVAVKNGWATKKVKLSKTKTYKYTAKFNGNANIQASKKVNSKAVLKNRLKTKIVMKKQYKVYSNVLSKIFTIKVLTASGKKVKDGKIRVRCNGVTTYGDVKNGKVKMSLGGLGMKHFKSMSGNTETYKKSITKVAKLKYIPASHKYKSSSKKSKAISIFKCPGCGKTTTHKHYAVGYYYTHVQIIRVV
nr:Ig-like domain repeat protein [uncultured Methanobrevibacter sp.]